MAQQTAVSKMETTQTAVEWLFEQLVFKSDFEHLPNQYFLMSDKNIDKIFEQAKAMEKEQIENAYEKGAEESWDAEKYYNEKYKK